MNEFDVIVVGGGPGGSTAASFIGKAGKKVLLLEKAKFPRDKTCGDAISGKSLSVLRELGLDKVVEANPHGLVTGVLFSSPKGDVVEIPFGTSHKQIRNGYCSRRMVYDNILFQNSKKFATVKENFMVTEVIVENGFVVGVKGINNETKQPEEYRAKIVIGGDGATSVVANKMGLSTLPDEHWCLAVRAYYDGITGMTGNIELHFIPEILPGYFWIFPMENGLANVGVGMVKTDMAKHKINLKEAMLNAIESSPLFKERFANAKIVDPVTGKEGSASDVKGWNLPFGSFHRKNHGNGFMLVGDAASLIDPFTGEGIGNAMLSGKTAGEHAVEALKAGDYSEKFLSEYDKKLWSIIAGELNTSYQMQKLGRNTFLLNLIVAKAARNPEIRDFIAGTLINEEAKKEFFSPLFYIKLLVARPWLP
ncbi:geranylgeranyl reductase family protein [Candidatus Micrarchaeota archaeon]|nr:geranylgeranyl reductase family protein [Candidatus Micrarchaeota archaeon]